RRHDPPGRCQDVRVVDAGVHLGPRDVLTIDETPPGGGEDVPRLRLEGVALFLRLTYEVEPLEITHGSLGGRGLLITERECQRPGDVVTALGVDAGRGADQLRAL